MTNTEAAEPVFSFLFDIPDEGVQVKSTRPDEEGLVRVRLTAVWFNNGWDIIPNVELFQSALDQITNNPESWNQRKWLSVLKGEVSLSAAPECGTAGCLAGTVALLSGGRPHYISDSILNFNPEAWDYARLPSGRVQSVSDLAWEKLGISSQLSVPLFDATRTLIELWELSQVICGGQLTVPKRSVIDAAQEVSWHLYGRAR